MRTQHAVAACLLRLRAAGPGDNRAVTDDKVAAGCDLRLPGLGFDQFGEPGGLQATRHRARGEVGRPATPPQMRRGLQYSLQHQQSWFNPTFSWVLTGESE